MSSPEPSCSSEQKTGEAVGLHGVGDGLEIHHTLADGHKFPHCGVDVTQVKIHEALVQFINGDRRILALIHGPGAIEIATKRRVANGERLGRTDAR